MIHRKSTQEIVLFNGCEDLTSVKNFKDACQDFFGINSAEMGITARDNKRLWVNLYNNIQKHLHVRHSVNVTATQESWSWGSTEPLTYVDQILFGKVRIKSLGALFSKAEGRVVDPDEMEVLLDAQEVYEKTAREVAGIRAIARKNTAGLRKAL